MAVQSQVFCEQKKKTKKFFHWNPQSKINRGRGKNTWRRKSETEMNYKGRTWSELKETAKDVRAWGYLLEAPAPTGDKK